MSPLYEHAVSMLVAELRGGLPTELLESDLTAAGVPVRDPQALRAYVLAVRSQEVVARLVGEPLCQPTGQRGRPRSTLKQAILAAAFEHARRDGVKRPQALGKAAIAMGTTKDTVEKAVRAVDRAEQSGDALFAVVNDIVARVLPLAIAETERDAASAERARHRARHIHFPPECQPFSARPVAQ